MSAATRNAKEEIAMKAKADDLLRQAVDRGDVPGVGCMRNRSVGRDLRGRLRQGGLSTSPPT